MGRAPDDGAAWGWVGPTLAVCAVILIALLSVGRVSAVFGDSDEGINAAVWATDSRALREAGPVDSRLGGIRLDGSRYATHPPGIVLETAAAEAVAGEREWATRFAAWAGSILAIFLVYRLLRTASFDPLVAGAATAVTALTPMLLVYGSMLDTPVTAFPFGVAVILLWFRQWKADPGSRATHPVLVGLVCVLGAVSGWQVVVLIGLCAATLVIRAIRVRSRIWDAAPFIVGGVAGLALSLGWTHWVYGDFSVLTNKYSRRSGAASGSESGILDMLDFQIPWLVQLLGVGLVGFGGCIAALWNRPLRPLAAMSLGIVGLYAVIFHQAAAGHQYWNYWSLLPTTVGAAYILQRICRDASTRAPAVLCGLVAVVAFANLVAWPHPALDWINEGHRVVEATSDADYPDGQATAWYIGESYRPDAWIGYYEDRDPVEIATVEQARDLAAADPDALVIVLESCGGDDPRNTVCQRLGPDVTDELVSTVVPARGSQRGSDARTITRSCGRRRRTRVPRSRLPGRPN